jgi:hypothetical protein
LYIFKNKNKDKRYGMNLLVISSLHLNSLVTKKIATKLHVQNLSHIKVFLPFSFGEVYKEGLCFTFSCSKYRPYGMNQLKDLTQNSKNK